MPFVIPALLALLAVNLVTMLRFWQDKQRAIAGERRIAEVDLLGLALIGSSPGALLARKLFRPRLGSSRFQSCCS